MKDGTLILNVLHGKELRLNMVKEIIDKINTSLGTNVLAELY